MRTFVDVTCAGCARPFQKLASEVRRCSKHFCSAPCYRRNVDHRMLGKASAMAPYRRLPEYEKRVERSRLGGLARAANQSKERLSEIARLGVEARLAKLSANDRSAIAKKAAAVRRFGPAVFGVRLGRCASGGK